MNTQTLEVLPNRSSTPSSTFDFAHSQPVAFSRLAGTELRKMRDTRSAKWIILSVVALMILIPSIMLGLLMGGAVDSLSYIDFRSGAEPAVTILLPVLVILLVTSEFSQRTAVTTFTLVPDRGRIVAAKLSAALMAGAIALAGVVVAAAVFTAISIPFQPSDADVWNATWSGAGLYALTYLVDLLGAFAFGLLLLNSAGAIAVYFATRLVVPLLLMGMAQVESLGRIAPWIDPLASSELLADPTRSAWAHLAVSSLLWIGIPMALGVRRILTTEIK